MIFRLWLRLLTVHLTILGIALISIFFLLIEILKVIQWEILLQPIILKFPLYVVILSLLILLSFVSSIYLCRGLSEPYEQIQAKINWLLLGKYANPIFEKQKAIPNAYEPYHLLDHQLLTLRNKMRDLASDLQEFSAAPTFVGEETKEEIIEKERHRIARELHDSVSQQLFACMMMLSAINESMSDTLPQTLAQQLLKVEEIINNAQTEMRALLLHLRPIELADKSLKEGITQLLRELEPKIPQNVKWELEDIVLESGIEDHLFRIVQEAISNTLRHAKASAFEVYFHEVDGNIQLKMVDDGKGFDLNASSKLGSYGLNNMRERVKSLGGVIRIISLPTQGTVIDIKIPISRKQG